MSEREARYAEAIRRDYTMAEKTSAVMAVADAEHAWIEGALKDAQAESDRIWAEVEKWKAEVERLRAEQRRANRAAQEWALRAVNAEKQVAAVRALADEWEVIPMPRMGDHDATRRIARIMGKREAAAALHTALSSPEPVSEHGPTRVMMLGPGAVYHDVTPEPTGNDGLTDAERRDLAAEWRAQHERLPIATTEGDET